MMGVRTLVRRSAAAGLVAGTLGAGAAQTEEAWLSPEAFRTWTDRQVIRAVQGSDGTLFGHEYFGPGGAVVWQYADGSCLTGRWQAVASAICYVYKGVPGRSCLRYLRDEGGLSGIPWDVDTNARDRTQGTIRLQRTDLPPLSCADDREG